MLLNPTAPSSHVNSTPKLPTPKVGDDTKDAILRAAQDVLIEQGLAQTSLRQITARAGVNLAAVNYHFGSKEQLIEAILKKHLSEINRERLVELARLQEKADSQHNGRIRPSEVVEVFFGTLLKRLYDPQGRLFLRLLGQAHAHPDGFIRTLFAQENEEILRRMLSALTLALPDVSRTEIIWRLDFMVGAMAYAISGVDSLGLLAAWAEDTTESSDERTHRLYTRFMSFLMGGFRAPLPSFDGANNTIAGSEQS